MVLPGDVYFDEPFLTIRWDSLHHHVLSEWRTFATSAELRRGLLKGIKAIKDHHAAAYVSDARKVKVIVHEDAKWVKEKWMPLAVDAGLKRIAFVTAATGLGKLTIEDIGVLLDENGLQARTFIDSMAEARKWVSQSRAAA